MSDMSEARREAIAALDGRATDPVEASRRTEESVRRVDEHSAEEEKRIIYDAMTRTALECAEVWSDEIWARLPDGFEPREARVFGPLMRRAIRNGLIEPTGEFRESQRPRVHRNPVRVYRSLVCGT